MNFGQSKPTSFADGIKLLEGYLADAGATYNVNAEKDARKIILAPNYNIENIFDDSLEDGQFIAALRDYQEHKNDKNWPAAKKSAGIVAFETLEGVAPAFGDGIEILKNLLSNDAIDSTGRNEDVIATAEALVDRYMKMSARLNGNVINYTVRGQTPEIYATVSDRKIMAKRFNEDLDNYFDLISDAVDGNEENEEIAKMFPAALALKDLVVKKNIALLGSNFAGTVGRIVNTFYDITKEGRSTLSSMLQEFLPKDPMMAVPERSNDLSESNVDFDALSEFLRGLDNLDEKLDDRDMFPLEDEKSSAEGAASEPVDEEPASGEEGKEDDKEKYDITDAQSLFNYYGVGDQEDDEYLDDVKDVLTYERSIDRAQRNADLEYAKMTGEYDFGQTINDTVESYLQSWRGLTIRGTISKEHTADMYEENQSDDGKKAN